MKHKLHLVLITLLFMQLFVISCSEKDNETGMEEDNTPSLHDAAEKLSSQVIIKGAIKKEGIVPNKKGEITLEPVEAKTGSIALLDEGFELPLFVESDSDVIGAYIEFGLKPEGDNTTFFSASSYYDVNLIENNLGSKTSKEKMIKKNSPSLSAKFSYKELDVDFSKEIATGQICFFISVYDGNGNISESQQICLDVLPWGDNSDLIGKWNYTKKEKYPPQGEVKEITLGEEDCFNDTLNCSNGDSLEFSYCTTITDRSYEFFADGTYTYKSTNLIAGLDFQSSYDNCELVSNNSENIVEEKGKWVYNSDANSIILANYEYNTGDSNNVNELGGAFVTSLTKVVIESNAFSFGWPLTGIDINGDGLINDDDSGYADFYSKQ